MCTSVRYYSLPCPEIVCLILFVSNWYGECEEANTLTPVTVITTATTTTAEVTTASTTAVTSSKTGKSKHETSCEHEGSKN